MCVCSSLIVLCTNTFALRFCKNVEKKTVTSFSFSFSLLYIVQVKYRFDYKFTATNKYYLIALKFYKHFCVLRRLIKIKGVPAGDFWGGLKVGENEDT